MVIELLGTGSAEGCPALFCKCDVCRESLVQGGKNIRTRASAIIDGCVKIDLPPETLYHVHHRNLDLAGIEFLVFTHAHDDHLSVAELQYLSWMFLPSPRLDPLRIFASSSVIQKISEYINLETTPLELIQLDAFTPITFGEWTIVAVPANHDPSQVCFNLILERNGKRLLYATDTGWYHDSTWDYLENIKLDGVVVECGKGPIEDGYEGHLNVNQVIEMHERLIQSGTISIQSPFITTHHSHLGGLLHDQIEAIFLPHGIHTGYDSMKFSV